MSHLLSKILWVTSNCYQDHILISLMPENSTGVNLIWADLKDRVDQLGRALILT
jgi:hypothetical protein